VKTKLKYDNFVNPIIVEAF